MKKIFTLLTFSWVTFIYAQTPLPYQSGFDTMGEKMGWTQYEIGVDDDSYLWSYESFMFFSSPECLTHYYPVGGTQQTDDWFVSPLFDFSNGGTIDSLRYAFSGFGTPMAGDTIAIYLLNGSDDPTVATATMLYSFTDSTYMNDNVWRKIENVTIPAASGQSYIAFRYTTTVNWLDVRLDNLGISGNGIDLNNLKSNKPDIELFPNPAHDQLQLKISGSLKSSELQINLYNSIGALVLQQEVTDGEFISVSHLSGAFTYKLTDSEQKVLKSGQLLIR